MKNVKAERGERGRAIKTREKTNVLERSGRDSNGKDEKDKGKKRRRRRRTLSLRASIQRVNRHTNRTTFQMKEEEQEEGKAIEKKADRA